MKLVNKGLVKFDYQFPLYNFFFPSQSQNVYLPDDKQLSNVLANANVQARSRALYFHIPFCEAICSFCPFTRGLYKGSLEIDKYVDALIKEIEYKSRIIDMKAVPVRAVFFGGGTPSLLSPCNIKKLGEVLHHYFDMSTVEEFSVEFSATSVTKERVAAFADIGASHARFGLQTINAQWRRLFNLEPDIKKIDCAAELLQSRFDHVLCDIIYGMNGSNEQQTLVDIDKAVDLGLTNIDIYPINNAATSVKLHKQIRATFGQVMPTMRKLNMKFMIDAHLREKGYVPYNGHGYVYMPDASVPLITGDYSFVYHEHVYGYSDHDLLGFGVGAISSVSGSVITNTSSREKYIQRMAKEEYICHISSHDPLLDKIKPLVLRLAYHGSVEKKLIDLEGMPQGLMSRLEELLGAGLVVETDFSYQLTRLGWLWYSNIMFYLIPESEQNILKHLVFSRLDTPGRDITEDELIYAVACDG